MTESYLARLREEKGEMDNGDARDLLAYVYRLRAELREWRDRQAEASASLTRCQSDNARLVLENRELRAREVGPDWTRRKP